MFDIKKGSEQGVNWIIDSHNIDPIVITVYQIDNPDIRETIEYEINWKNPIWGYDALDTSNVEEILDSLINKYKNKSRILIDENFITKWKELNIKTSIQELDADNHLPKIKNLVDGVVKEIEDQMAKEIWDIINNSN